jgi:hypothetical protein
VCQRFVSRGGCWEEEKEEEEEEEEEGEVCDGDDT